MSIQEILELGIWRSWNPTKSYELAGSSEKSRCKMYAETQIAILEENGFIITRKTRR